MSAPVGDISILPASNSSVPPSSSSSTPAAPNQAVTPASVSNGIAAAPAPPVTAHWHPDNEQSIDEFTFNLNVPDGKTYGHAEKQYKITHIPHVPHTAVFYDSVYPKEYYYRPLPYAEALEKENARLLAESVKGEHYVSTATTYVTAHGNNQPHGKPVYGEVPKELELTELLGGMAPVAPASHGSSGHEGVYATPLASPLADSPGAGVFGSTTSLTVEHNGRFQDICGHSQWSYKDNQNADLLKGVSTTKVLWPWLTWFECLGWWEPFNRSWEIGTVAGNNKAFSFNIESGWLDSMKYIVKDAKDVEIGRICAPSFVQRMSDQWRTTMQTVLRLVDSAGYERFTLRRAGPCVGRIDPICAKFAPDRGLDQAYGHWDCRLDKWISFDMSKYDCGNCNDKCGQKEGQPCLKFQSSKQTRVFPEFKCCFTKPGVPYFNCDCYQCDKIGKEQVQCYRCPLCTESDYCHQRNFEGCERKCSPGGGCGYACTQDCKICCKIPIDCSATLLKCNCTKGCKTSCIKFDCKCFKCTDCCSNWCQCYELQFYENMRVMTESYDRVLASKVCCSKFKPCVCQEWGKFRDACKMVPSCVKNSVTKCPHRFKQVFCGGRDVHIELDVYGPNDGASDEPVAKISYDGVSGWCCAGAATLRPRYQCTILFPAVSPYYQHTHKTERAPDFVDLALLTSLALWYDYYCVAPREYFQCTRPDFLESDFEKLPAYRIREVDPYPEAYEHQRLFGFLFGEEMMWLVDNHRGERYFEAMQKVPAGTIPMPYELPKLKF